jgi:hypothetical protein
MRENLKRQNAAHLARFGVPLSAQQLRHALRQMLALQPWYFEDAVNADARPELSRPSYWAALVPGACADPDALVVSIAAAVAARAPRVAPPSPDARAAVEGSGYIVAAPTPRTAALCATLWEIAGALSAAALPPHFIFVYNAPWELLEEQMATVAADVLGEGAVLEADMACWVLRREGGAVGESYVGGAFSASHRDQTYAASHDAEGAPLNLNVWVPFNPSGARAGNGAMRVLPVPHDDFFFCPEHPLHLDTQAALAGGARAAAVALECARGGACAWSPSVVHWGGRCAVDAPQEPRASVAATFRRVGAPRSVFGAALGGGEGPPPVARDDLLRAMPLARRLAYVAKGVLSYSHWAPGLPGVELAAEVGAQGPPQGPQ